MKIKILDCKLLSFEEARKVDYPIVRIDNCWWLRSPNIRYNSAAAYVTNDGAACRDAGSGIVDRYNFSIRPALYLESQILKSFELAGHSWINVFNNVYLCEDCIGVGIFNDNKSNKYEGSYIQKFILSWFKNQGLEFNIEIELNEYSTIIKDFVYKIDESNKLSAQTEYDSIEEYFESNFTNDIKLDTLIICTADTKISLIKLEKLQSEIDYKFIVDITLNDEDNFTITATIKAREQLNKLIEQVINILNQDQELSKYVSNLENCIV